MRSSRYIKLCLILIFFFVGYTANAQRSDTTLQPTDTTRREIIRAVQKLIPNEAAKSLKKYKDGRLVMQQTALLNEVRKTSERIKIYLKHGIDTAAVAAQISRMYEGLNIMKEGVFVHQGNIQTQRNLQVSSIIVRKLLKKANAEKAAIGNYASNMISLKDRLDSLTSENILYDLSADSGTMMTYITKLVVVAKEINPIDSQLTKTIASIQTLQARIDVLLFQLNVAQDDMERLSNEVARSTVRREAANIWAPVEFKRPLKEILDFSIAKEKLAWTFYISDNLGRLLLMVLLLIAGSIFLYSLKKRLKDEQVADTSPGQLVVKHPIASSLVVIISIYQFVFSDPPFIFSFGLWVTSALALVRIFKGYISPYWMRFWITMIVLFICAGLNNLVLQASRLERWYMLILSLIGIIHCSSMLLKKSKQQELKEKKILYFIAIVVLLETASLLFNVYGRFNIAKTLMATGYIGIIVAILFLWSIRLINDCLLQATKVFKHPEKTFFYINFDKIGNSAPWFLYVLLIVGWFFLIGKNFYMFRYVSEPLSDMLTTQRTLGDYTFTINSIAIFALILLCSLLLSRIISFFTSEQSIIHAPQQKGGKASLGSWILLIRIFVICGGLFLAFAAAGIPLDKITIILGALSVGIGLGLQGVVSNLVSGLIIAFEKPVNVGDNIEVGGKIGVMKSIGFRSSVMVTLDGAHVVIPNGDLLSEHLVNWSMSRNIKRNIITVGVAYGTDLDKVKKLLYNILESNNRILKHPVPIVAAKQFSASSVDFDIKFWVSYPDITVITGEVVAAVDKAFAEAGIVIPFPQQDVHVRKE